MARVPREAGVFLGEMIEQVQGARGRRVVVLPLTGVGMRGTLKQTSNSSRPSGTSYGAVEKTTSRTRITLKPQGHRAARIVSRSTNRSSQAEATARLDLLTRPSGKQGKLDQATAGGYIVNVVKAVHDGEQASVEVMICREDDEDRQVDGRQRGHLCFALAGTGNSQPGLA